MMFKNKLAMIASALIIAGSVYARQEALCPDINDIKAEGLSMAEQIYPGLFFSYNLSTYNTSSHWGFAIAPIEAESDSIAVDFANKLLSTMTAPGIPEIEGEATVCLYNTGNPDVLAAAVNTDQMISPSQLKHYIQKVR